MPALIRLHPVLLSLGTLSTLAACLDAGPLSQEFGGRMLTATVEPAEEQMFGGMETYLDEDGKEQVIYWDGIRMVTPVMVTADDGLPLVSAADNAAARMAAEAACQAQGLPGLETEARIVRMEGSEGAVTAIRFEGCTMPEGGA